MNPLRNTKIVRMLGFNFVTFFSVSFGTSDLTIDAMVKNPPTNARDRKYAGSLPGSGRSVGVENGNSLQYSCLKNSMGRGTWQATVHGVPKNQTQLVRSTQLDVLIWSCVCKTLLRQTLSLIMNK